MSITKEDLMDLRLHQLKELVKQIKNKLNLNVTGENKQKLVNAIYMIHNGNKFNNKKLLSFNTSGHIQLPKPANKKTEGTVIKKFKPRTIKNSVSLKKGELQDEIKNAKKSQYKDIAPLKRKFNTTSGYLEL